VIKKLLDFSDLLIKLSPKKIDAPPQIKLSGWNWKILLINIFPPLVGAIE
jgi:hypothetical protein